MPSESSMESAPQVLLGRTEAAGEDQPFNSALMINFTFPGPCRSKQRVGSIHRYGQERLLDLHFCGAGNTRGRESAAKKKLLDRLREIRRELEPTKCLMLWARLPATTSWNDISATCTLRIPDEHPDSKKSHVATKPGAFFARSTKEPWRPGQEGSKLRPSSARAPGQGGGVGLVLRSVESFFVQSRTRRTGSRPRETARRAAFSAS